MGLRLILILAAIWVIYLVGRRLLADRRRGDGAEPRPVLEMVRCAHCGTHLPRTEALRNGDLWYCSVEHRELGRRGQGQP